MLKELKANAEEVKKMMYEQKGNINKKDGKPKINQKEILELKITMFKIRKFTKGIQRWI